MRLNVTLYDLLREPYSGDTQLYFFTFHKNKTAPVLCQKKQTQKERNPKIHNRHSRLILKCTYISVIKNR